ncbi:MAG TPA: L-threonylcarbamoyladenylate synthase [Candidatus Limnocylindrales bacterium]
MTRVISAHASEALDAAVAALKSGLLVGIPTETVYGVCALPDQASVERLIAAKRRSNEKGIQILVDSLDQVRSLAVVTVAAEQLAGRFWPGAMTIVLERRPDIDLTPLLGGGRTTLGVRLPDHDTPRHLARLLGPIAASSANISGQPDATTPALVEQALGDDLELILDDGPVRGGTPSTVVDCSDASVPPRILREGAISARDIAAALR